MPRPRNALGRPGTAVVPHDWETAHAPVATKTFTASCVIWPGDANTAEPIWSDEAGSPVRPPAQPVHGTLAEPAPCRVQVMNQRLALKLLGDQAAKHMTYLVAIERGVRIPTGAIVEIRTSSDPLLEPGHHLTVADVMRGTLTFQRDLVCIDDLNPHTPDEE